MRVILVAAAIWVAQGAPARAVPPENPCELLTVEQVAQAAGVKVTAARRVRSRGEDKQTPLPLGSICNYETESAYGWISIAVQRPPLATPSTYRETRDFQFSSSSGSAQAVPGVGQDAFISGFAMIRVLVRDDLQFYVMIQSGPDSTGVSSGLLISVAKALVSRLGR